ncbi:MAG: hypothetical protein M3Y71_17305 [Actinomycetota bacterium]|nr:hypothetical protein [Actinomycetota bacterium]
MLPKLPTRPTAGRSLATGLLAAAVAAGVAGCSTIDKAQSAAVVNGSAVSTVDLATATRQYNATFAAPSNGTPATEQQVLPFLVNAKIIGPWATRTGGWKPDASYAAALARVGDPAPATRDLLQAVTVASLFQQGQLPQAAAAALEADLRSAKVQLAPRYGTFDATAPFVLKTLTPGWIKPGSPNPAATTPAAPQQ